MTEAEMMYEEEMKKVAEKLNGALEEFDCLIFFPDAGSGDLLDGFCGSEALRQTAKRVLILSDADISGRCCGSYEYCRLSAGEQEALKSLYLTYEFSDRFLMIADYPKCGGLLNYVKTGVLTMEEAFEAILG